MFSFRYIIINNMHKFITRMMMLMMIIILIVCAGLRVLRNLFHSLENIWIKIATTYPLAVHLHLCIFPVQCVAVDCFLRNNRKQLFFYTSLTDEFFKCVMETESVRIILTRDAQVLVVWANRCFRWCLISTNPQYGAVQWDIIFYCLSGFGKIS
jgi:hypothetical protein